MRFDLIRWETSQKRKGYYPRQKREPLVFTTLGPASLYEASTGLDKKLWTFYVSENSVYVSSGTTIVKLFEESGVLAEITGTFDQLGFPLVFYRLEGEPVDWEFPIYNIFNQGILKVYWYDTIEQAPKITLIGKGRTPFVLFDMLYEASSEYSDYILFYIEEGLVKYRVQRERLEVVHLIPLTVEWNDLIDFVEMDETFHLQVVLRKVTWEADEVTDWTPEEKAGGQWVSEV